MVDPYNEAAAQAWEAFKAGRHDEATTICEDMLSRSPNHAGLRGIYGIIAGERGDIEAAVQNLQRARSCAPGNPDWSFNLGIAHLRGGHFGEARSALLEAVRLRPDSIKYLIELAILYVSMDEDRDALAICLDVIAREPDNADAHLLLAETLLRRGEMSLGWGAYVKGHRIRRNFQKKAVTATTAAPAPALPRWNGKRSPDISVLLDCDQGFAEMIQFARYVPLVVPLCKSVTLRGPVELVPLLSRIPEVTVAAPGQQPQPAYTQHAMLSELPELFATTAGNIPGGMSYLDADPARVQVWHERLERFRADWSSPRALAHCFGEQLYQPDCPSQADVALERDPGRGNHRNGESRDRTKAFLGKDRMVLVGLVWSGETTNQRQARCLLTSAQLAPLLAVPGVAFISLQGPTPPGDVDAMRKAHVLDLSAELTDFGETAAVLANLDLTISIDSPIAHLAGSLGRTVWVLLPRPADWRWFRDREDSPWYPTMRLFRQGAIGEWGGPVAQAAAALGAFVVEGARSRTVLSEAPQAGSGAG